MNARQKFRPTLGRPGSIYPRGSAGSRMILRKHSRGMVALMTRTFSTSWSRTVSCCPYSVIQVEVRELSSSSCWYRCSILASARRRSADVRLRSSSSRRVVSIRSSSAKPTIITIITSPAQSHLGTARRYPHLGECTLPLRVLAVACTMRNEALRDVTGALQGLTNSDDNAKI